MIDPCGFVAVGVADLDGHSEFGSAFPLHCPHGEGPSLPHATARLTVLVGARVLPYTVRIVSNASPVQVVVRRGDALAFDGPGGSVDFLPDVDSRYLAAVDAVPPCPLAGDCVRGEFVWRWMTRKVGTTRIWLRPNNICVTARRHDCRSRLLAVVHITR